MSYLHTSPYGRIPHSTWECNDCPDGGDSLAVAEQPADLDAMRDQAIAHVRSAGHEVTVLRGTRETIAPVKLSPEGTTPQ